jgi:Fe-S cluster biosynthesis and repair protein YggX
MQTLRIATHIAKKEHHCDFCNLPIEIGSKYEAQSNIIDNEFYTWKTHYSCSVIASKLNMYDTSDEGVTSEDFHEFIDQEYHKLMNPKFAQDPELEKFCPNFKGRLLFVKQSHNVS